MEKRVVIVTGAGKGIGKEIALQYGKGNYRVVVVDLIDDHGESVKNEIIASGGEAIYCKTNVSSIVEIEKMFHHVQLIYHKVDILINNAGISKWYSPFEMSVEDWDLILNTNLRSVFFCSREGAKLMKNGGFIVNIASTRAFMSEPNSEAYAASKGGIIALTHALAASFSSKHIKVNAISPGWIETEDYKGLRAVDHKQHLSGRVGKPNDIAKACLYLTSEDNDFITGSNFIIDGGMTKKMIYEK